MLRLVATYIIFSGLSALALWGSEGKLAFMFEETISLMMPLATLCGALSFAFYNYVDGIMKDLPKSSEMQEGKSEQRKIVVGVLTELKGEVVANVIAVLCLLMLNYVFVKLSVFLIDAGLMYACELRLILLACSGGTLFTSFLVCVVQLKGFVTANELRKIVSNGG